MSNIISKNNKYFDLDTKEGCYEYIGEFLNENGANSTIWSCLSRLFKTLIIKNDHIVDLIKDKRRLRKVNEKLLYFISKLKHGDCWCSKGIGDPRLSTCQDYCLEIQKFMKGIENE